MSAPLRRAVTYWGAYPLLLSAGTVSSDRLPIRLPFIHDFPAVSTQRDKNSESKVRRRKDGS